MKIQIRPVILGGEISVRYEAYELVKSSTSLWNGKLKREYEKIILVKDNGAAHWRASGEFEFSDLSTIRHTAKSINELVGRLTQVYGTCVTFLPWRAE